MSENGHENDIEMGDTVKPNSLPLTSDRGWEQAYHTLRTLTEGTPLLVAKSFSFQGIQRLMFVGIDDAVFNASDFTLVAKAPEIQGPPSPPKPPLEPTPAEEAKALANKLLQVSSDLTWRDLESMLSGTRYKARKERMKGQQEKKK